MAGTTLKVRPNKSHEEATIIRRCYKSFAPRNLVLGEKWFVIDMAWWSRWTEYSGFSTQYRGKIRRLPSMEGETVTVPAIRNARLRRYEHGLIKLRTGLSANHDYKIVPQRVSVGLRLCGRECLPLYAVFICLCALGKNAGSPPLVCMRRFRLRTPALRCERDARMIISLFHDCCAGVGRPVGVVWC